LRWVEPQHLAQIGFDGLVDCAGIAGLFASPDVAGKRSFFHAAVDPSFFEGFKRGRLRAG
jgi:hypothetical protein